jgi:hypothetical protein
MKKLTITQKRQQAAEMFIELKAEGRVPKNIFGKAMTKTQFIKYWTGNFK